MIQTVRGPEGSSPLARGLRRGPDARRSGIGIIPARAGFTQQHKLTVDELPDHPRSRGVYALSDPAVRCSPGSSPLARGLPAHRLRQPVKARIIPARAGFTLKYLFRRVNT